MFLRFALIVLLPLLITARPALANTDDETRKASVPQLLKPKPARAALPKAHLKAEARRCSDARTRAMLGMGLLLPLHLRGSVCLTPEATGS